MNEHDSFGCYEPITPTIEDEVTFLEAFVESEGKDEDFECADEGKSDQFPTLAHTIVYVAAPADEARGNNIRFVER